MLRHFDIWPYGMNKNDLIEEQRIFLIYLMGCIPTLDGWSMQVDYLKSRQDIDEMTIADIEINKEDIDLAELHGTDIRKLKRERLKDEKEKKLKELKNKYGIKDTLERKDNPIDKVHGKIDDSVRNLQNERQRLWDMLDGKGLLKKKE